MKSKTKNMKSSDRKSADRKSSDRKSSDTDDCNDNAKLEHKANTHFSQTKKALISYAKQGKGNKKLIQTRRRFRDPIEDRLFVTGVGLDKDMQKMIYLHEDYLYGTALELRTRNDQTSYVIMQ
eukprot:89257_1